MTQGKMTQTRHHQTSTKNAADPRAVILELARESRGRAVLPLLIWILVCSPRYARATPLRCSGNIKAVGFVPLDSRPPVITAGGCDNWGDENDGVRRHPRLLAAYGAPRRHSRACSGIQRKERHCLHHL